MKNGISITKDSLESLKKSLKEFSKKDVLVGVPAEETDRNDVPVTNAMVGYIAENGAPEQNIPARPWLNPGVRNAKDGITKYFEQAGKAYLDNHPEMAERALMAAGLSAQTSVKNKIATGPFQALAESTIAARRRRGVTRTDPLKDTLQFLNSVTYVIRKK